MKCFIYCDESGEASFSKNSVYKYFSICTLTIDEGKRSKIKNTIKKKKSKLYTLGWPKEIEIKANILHSLKSNPNIPQVVKDNVNGDNFIQEVLISLKNSCSPRIDYIIVNKEGLKPGTFDKAPYGIAYNYFAGKILIPIILDCKDCYLTIDKRNKEMHNHMHFSGYIETKVRGDAMEKGIDINLEIKHGESQNESGLQAVDFFSWSIYRNFAHNDSRFLDIFTELIKIKEKWYC